MSRIYCYNPNRLVSARNPDIQKWLTLFKIIHANVTFVDRTNTIKLPIRTAIPVALELPSYDANFTMTYEECCQSRVRELLAKQEKLDVPIRILYSGGIDSSLILASFIKELGESQLAQRVQIVMSQDSIEENPWMWERLLRRSNLTMIDGYSHGGDWGTDRILVGGEFNDQLLGSAVYRDVVKWRGDAILEQPWTENLMTEYHLRKGLDQSTAEMWTSLFASNLRAAPCPVETVADWWWWINFSCKWHSVYFRMLMFVHDTANITQQYLDDHYCQFYGDENFQRWSMVDRKHKIDGSLITYKWHARQLVADICGKEYLSKVKKGSLWRLLSFKKSADLLDNDYNYIFNAVPDNWYEPDNSFGYFATS